MMATERVDRGMPHLFYGHRQIHTPRNHLTAFDRTLFPYRN
jgi:hypothetical protein